MINRNHIDLARKYLAVERTLMNLLDAGAGLKPAPATLCGSIIYLLIITY
jgi:hypothetical protein